MKVIGTDGRDYICIVNHTELEKLADKYYGKIGKMNVGDVMDLGAGYDFLDQIRGACKAMIDAETTFSRAKGTLMSFAVMVAALPASTVEDVKEPA